MDFKRQVGIFDPEENKQYKLSIIGCGSVGSFTALALAKMGANIVEVFDSDKVEEHNLPNQFFRNEDVELEKTDALAILLRKFSDCVPIEMNGNVDEKTVLKGNIVVSAVDSIDARKLIWERVKASKPMLYIDSRMGGRIFSVHTVDMLNDTAVKGYGERLKETGQGLEVPCTEKSIIFNVLGLASFVCNQIVEFTNQKELEPTIHFDYANYTIVKEKWRSD